MIARVLVEAGCRAAVVALAALAALSLLTLESAGTRAAQEERTTALLAVNDIYRLRGVGPAETGGLHRLATLRARLEREYPQALLLHAGDFLAPSLLSRSLKGRQMVDVMNRLDGPGEDFDPRFFVTFGNHEFDDTKCGSDKRYLVTRIEESRFTWLTDNLDFSGCQGLSEVPALPQVDRMQVVESGGIKVGIFGISRTGDPENAETYPATRPTLEVAAEAIGALKAQGAEFIVALTHLPWKQDEALLAAAGPDGLDLIVGGHDHNNMALPADRPRIFKADSDARTAWRIVLRIAADGTRSVEGSLITLNNAIEPDPAVAKAADGWLEGHDRTFCQDNQPPLAPGCLARVYGHTNSEIVAEELANRGSETGFGDWLADQIREAAGSDVALINSGSLRLNYDLPPDSDITRRQIEELIQYDDPIVSAKITLEALRAAIDHALRSRGSGGWSHLSGVTVTLDAEGGLGRLKLDKAPAALEDDSRISVASLPFVLCGGDKHPFGVRGESEDLGACRKRLIGQASARFSTSDACRDRLREAGAGEGPEYSTLKARVVSALCVAGDAGITPEKQNRIRTN